MIELAEGLKAKCQSGAVEGQLRGAFVTAMQASPKSGAVRRIMSFSSLSDLEEQGEGEEPEGQEAQEDEHIDFDNFEIGIPSSTEADAQHAQWKLHGSLRVTTRSGAGN